MKIFSILVIILLSATLSAQVDLDRGLIGYWSLDHNGINQSPNRLPRTDFEFNKVTFPPGFLGASAASAAAKFYGDSYARLEEGLQSQDFGLSLWFNTDTRIRTGTLLAWDQKGYRMEILPGGKLSCALYVTNNYFYNYIHETANLADGQWHHVVMSLKDDVFQVFLDGEKVNEKKQYSGISVYYEGGGMQIGGSASAENKNYFSGLIDEICLYNRGLSEDEVTVLFSKPHIVSDPDFETGLILYLPFNDDDFNHSPNAYSSSDVKVYGGSLVENCELGSPFKLMKLFNGVDHYLSGTSALELPVFSLRFTFQSTSSRESFLIGWESGGYQVILNPEGNEGKLAFKFFQSKPQEPYTFATLKRLNDGDCHRVAMCFDGKQLRIYIDGELVDDKCKSKTDQPVYYGEGSFIVGNDSKQGKGHGFHGKMDEIRLYNRVLSEAEVKSMPLLQENLTVHRYDSKEGGKVSYLAASNPTKKSFTVTLKDKKDSKDFLTKKVAPGANVLEPVKLSIGEYTVSYK